MKYISLICKQEPYTMSYGHWNISLLHRRDNKEDKLRLEPCNMSPLKGSGHCLEREGFPAQCNLPHIGKQRF